MTRNATYGNSLRKKGRERECPFPFWCLSYLHIVQMSPTRKEKSWPAGLWAERGDWPRAGPPCPALGEEATPPENKEVFRFPPPFCPSLTSAGLALKTLKYLRHEVHEGNNANVVLQCTVIWHSICQTKIYMFYAELFMQILCIKEIGKHSQINTKQDSVVL